MSISALSSFSYPPLSTPLPSTRQIRFLLALHDQGSFHKAASYCGVTQSTISTAIREMEIILGVDLIDRSNRKKLVFTPFGQDMLQTGKQVIAQLAQLADQARRSEKLLSTTLRIGIIPTIAPYLLPRILRPLQQAFPDLVLHLHELQTKELLHRIENGSLDYGIMAFPYETPHLRQFPLQVESFFCAAPKALFPRKKQITLHDVERQNILLLSDGHCLRHHALSACSLPTIAKHNTRHGPPQDDISATGLSTLIQLVAAGYGVTLLPDMVVQHTTLPDQITALPISNAPTREIGSIWRKNAPIEKDAMALSLAIHRLMHNVAISHQKTRPDPALFRHIDTSILMLNPDFKIGDLIL